MSKKLAGKKYSNSHTTVIEEAYNVAKKLEVDADVYKIALGVIRQSRGGSDAGVIKINEIPAGLEIIVKSKRYVQTLYVYIHEPERNQSRIKRLFML